MSRFLTTIPNNSGFYNFGTIEAYPTGGTGPTAYGPTSYYGSDPLPANTGDSLNNPVDLGTFPSIFRSIPIKNTHGGLSRKQTTFYKLKLPGARAVQFTQDYSQFSYEKNTNKNTLLAFYRITEDKLREELPINDEGYVYTESAIDYLDESVISGVESEYPTTNLAAGDYLFLITNDIRYLETTYSITLNINLLDWGKVIDEVDASILFEFVTDVVTDALDFENV
jgi:hypothetical protein